MRRGLAFLAALLMLLALTQMAMAEESGEVLDKFTTTLATTPSSTTATTTPSTDRKAPTEASTTSTEVPTEASTTSTEVPTEASTTSTEVPTESPAPSTTEPGETTTTEDSGSVVFGGDPPEGSIREPEVGLQASFESGLFGEVGEDGRAGVLGFTVDADYSNAVEAIEASWIWLVSLVLLIAIAIVSGLDRRRSEPAHSPH